MAIDNEYWKALERLKRNKPLKIQLNSPINKDTVALEAGKKRGSIRSSRSSFNKLIAAIEAANSNQNSPIEKQKKQLEKSRKTISKYKELYHESLNRELMLIERVSQLEKELTTSKKIIRIAERR